MLLALAANPAAAMDKCSTHLRPEGIRTLADSQFLKDVARYLTGDETDAETVYQAYKRRIKPGDPELPYPLENPAIDIPDRVDTLFKDLGIDQEKFTEPPLEKWEKSASGRWMRRLVKNSKVKGKPRLIYRRKGTSTSPAISIAQTWDALTGKTSREIELTVQRKGSADHDYFVYDSKGELAAESTFNTRSGTNITGPAPLTCLTCHYDRDKRRFHYLPMSYLSAEKLALNLEKPRN